MKKEFIEKYANKKKRSVLLPYLKDIQTLLENEATQSSITAYLKEEKNLVITQPNLSRFIKRYIEKNPLSKKSKIILEPKEEIKAPTETINTEEEKDSIFL